MSYLIKYGLDESITVETEDQMAIFTLGLLFKNISHSIERTA